MLLSIAYRRPTLCSLRVEELEGAKGRSNEISALKAAQTRLTWASLQPANFAVSAMLWPDCHFQKTTAPDVKSRLHYRKLQGGHAEIRG